MEGAWALIAVVDYLRGHDFAPSDGVKIKTEMRLLTADNVNEYAIILDKEAWKKINFKSFSRQHNPKLAKYDFSLSRVMQEIKRKK
jgi:hypothetical protein